MIKREDINIRMKPDEEEGIMNYRGRLLLQVDKRLDHRVFGDDPSFGVVKWTEDKIESDIMHEVYGDIIIAVKRFVRESQRCCEPSALGRLQGQIERLTEVLDELK